MAVSVVIPAYNEARRLPRSLPLLTAALREVPGSEVIIVDDGSLDGTAAVAAGLLRSLPGSRVIRLPWNSGKGAAIRVGVAAAAGDAIVFMDADLASDVSDLPALLAALEHAEVALGSRRIGVGADRTRTRQLGSWAFNQLARSITDLDIADTQCGFKAFRNAEAKVLFSLSRATGFGFDVEVLSLARSLGYRIVEVPVRWTEEPGGTFRIIRHTPAMIVDLARARRHTHRPDRPPAARPVEPLGGLTGYPGRHDDPAGASRARDERTPGGPAGEGAVLPADPHANGTVAARRVGPGLG
ncbi:dolichyl-phosphate beta-glucosyltransferase [Frankia nepalensis]|uniref:dolichyl-phosphate beta-glucosyltransferase n=1 Tax=Frankia nepalensis TaxID=1836974 RepID=UPI0027DC643B|nr:glycosyltransferase family 2 protein [Frankia nepalensis]